MLSECLDSSLFMIDMFSMLFALFCQKSSFLAFGVRRAPLTPYGVIMKKASRTKTTAGMFLIVVDMCSGHTNNSRIYFCFPFASRTLSRWLIEITVHFLPV